MTGLPRLREEDLLQTVREMARLFGFLEFHSYDSRRSTPGFPDCVFVHPKSGRLVFRELKTDVGKVTKAQQEWIDALAAGGHDAGVWRSADLRSGRIERELRAWNRAQSVS